MSWRCSLLRRKLVPYLEGGLARPAAERLEKHLAGCRECSGLLIRLREGDEAAREFGRIGSGSARTPRAFSELQTALGSRLDSRTRPFGSLGGVLHGLAASPALRTFVAVALAGAVILVTLGRIGPWRDEGNPAASLDSGEYRGFTAVRIAEFPSQSRTRVSTEGFVRDVYYDEQEKTLHIKLVERPQKSEPFVICEIPRPDGIALPKEGTHIRVYGMARFDAQPGRGWHEVNPVLTMAVLNR
jgi:hypothetical protein